MIHMIVYIYCMFQLTVLHSKFDNSNIKKVKTNVITGDEQQMVDIAYTNTTYTVQLYLRSTCRIQDIWCECKEKRYLRPKKSCRKSLLVQSLYSMLLLQFSVYSV